MRLLKKYIKRCVPRDKYLIIELVFEKYSMNKIVKISVSPKVLFFARKSAGFSVEEIVIKLNRAKIDVNVINFWESSGGEIPLSILRNLASIYKRPLTFFFLRMPPGDPIIPTDFRTLPNDEKNIESQVRLIPKAMFFIRRAKFIQQKTYELEVSLGLNLKKRLPKVGISENPSRFAEMIRKKIGIKISEQSKWKEPRIALKKWIAVIESFGIIIQQDSIEIQESFRGFSLSGNNKLMPLIFLSTKDSPNGRIFTLLHEFCHLMLIESGVIINGSDVYFDRNIRSVESFCNRFAASFLVPADLLLQHELVHGVNKNSFSDKELELLAKYFGVSSEVIVLRLKKINKVDQGFYDLKKKQWMGEERREKDGRRIWDQSYFNSNGAIYVSLVYESYHKNIIDTSQLLSNLNFKSKYIEKVENRLNQHFLSRSNG